jgi:hypothetical protein
MNVERENLVRFLFHELQELCSNHYLLLVDIDLCWDLTEKEAEEEKNT